MTGEQAGPRAAARITPAGRAGAAIRRAFVAFLSRERGPVWPVGVALVMFAAALAIRGALDPWVATRSVWTPFYLGALLSGLAGGLAAGYLNVALSLVGMLAIYVAPHGQFLNPGPADLVLAAGYSIVGLAIASVAALARSTVRRLVTARRRLEDQAQVVDLGHVFVRDMQGQIVAWSTGAERLYGWTREEAVGQPSRRLLRTRYPLPFASIEQQVRAHGEWEGELQHTRKDGTTLTVASHWALQSDADGLPNAILEVNNDVTRLKQAEEAVRDRDEKLRLALRCAQMGTWDWDLRSGTVSWSEAHFTLLGMAPGSRSPTFALWRGHVHGEDRVEVEAALERARDERTEFRATYRVVWPDGTVHWVEGRGRFLYDDGGEAYRGIGVILDIDARKRLEADLQEADRRKDEFLGMLAHELRNPLAPIRNAAHVLCRRGGVDAAATQAHGVIDRQIGHMARLLDDLLDVARITRGKIVLRKERVLLAELVRQAIEDVRPLVEEHGHVLALSVAPEAVWLEADAMRLEQVIANLLHNAAKYTQPGGCITVSAGRDGSDAVIRVRDTGVGIDPDLVPRLFDVFVQGATSLDRSIGGLGIGLALVRSLVELHGGRVEAHSGGAGLGSEFVVVLPVGPPTLSLVPPEEVPAVRPASGLRVLVVEDNADVAESVRMVLELDGHAVAVAPAGPQALEMVRADRPHVAFIDIGLPGMDGYELVRRLRALPGLAGTVLVALSGYGRREDKERARAAGFDRHLTKPVDPADMNALLAEVGRALDDEPPRGAELAPAR